MKVGVVELPILAHAARILETVRAHQVVVIAGSTGSGKTTQLPRLLWEAGLVRKRTKICCTLPTRSGTMNAAEFVAHSLGPQKAGVVGYRIRFDTCVTKDTQIVYMTDGVLAKRINADPLLREFSVIMIDEVHERRVHTDFLLAYLKSVLAVRHDLKVIVSSATMQIDALSRYFNNAPIISIPVKQYPVEVINQPVVHDQLKEVARLISKIHAKTTSGHTLVFLSGMFEIDRVRHHLRHVKLPSDVVVQVFHSRVGHEGRKKVFAQTDKRKVILSTNIAETAVTIPGVTHVVDTGWHREAAYDITGGYRTLYMKPISQASAVQRTGRAGRTGSGVCYRMYSAESFAARPEFAPPFMECGDVTDFVLQLLARGVHHPERLDLPTPLDTVRVANAMANLERWGAVTADRAVTEFGRRMMMLPLGPQQAYMLLTAADLGFAAEAVEVASILSVDQLGDLDTDSQVSFGGKFNQFRDPRGDAITFLRAFRAYSIRRGDAVWCESQGLNMKLLEDAHLIRASLLERLRLMGVRCTYGHDLDKVYRALVLCWGGRLLVHDRKGVYRSGELTDIRISDRSSVHGTRPEYVVAFDVLNVGVMLASNPLVVPDELIEQACALYGDPQAVPPCISDGKKLRMIGTLRIETPHVTRMVRVDVNCERSPSRVLRMVKSNTVVVEESMVPMHWLRLSAETLEALAVAGITSYANCPKTRHGMMRAGLPESACVELIGTFHRFGYAPTEVEDQVVAPVAVTDVVDGADDDWLVTDFVKSPIKEFGISLRAQMRLVDAGIHTIEDLLAVDERKFRSLCGKESAIVDEVLRRLGEFNLSLSSRQNQNHLTLMFEGPDPIEEANVSVAEARRILGDEDFDLLMQYRETTDSEVRIAARNRLIVKHQKLRWFVAKWWWSSSHRHDNAIEIEDMVQEATFGMMTAISKFNALNGFRISTYCMRWLRQAIDRFSHNTGSIRLPVHMCESVRKFQSAVMKLIAVEGREVTVREIAMALNTSPEEVLALRAMHNIYLQAFSLDMPVSSHDDGNEDSTSTYLDYLADETASVEQQMMELAQTQRGKDLSAEVINSLDLPARHLVIFRARYGLDGEDPKTLEAIGDLFQVTRERVRQIEAKVFEALRLPQNHARLCEVERAFRGDDLADDFVAPSASAVVEERRRKMRQIRLKGEVARVLRDLNVPAIAIAVFKLRHGLNGEQALSATAVSQRLGIALKVVSELEDTVESQLYDVDMWEQLRRVSPGLPRPEEPVPSLALVRQTGSVDLLMRDGFVPDRSAASVQDVIEAVALRTELTPDQIKGKERERGVQQARCLVVVVLHDHLRMTFEDIAIELHLGHRQTAHNVYRVGKSLFGVVTWKTGHLAAASAGG